MAGVSGYAGVELLRILRAHPHVSVTALAAGRAAGGRLSDSWPALLGGEDPELLPLDAEALAARCQLVFLALPHGVSASVVPSLLDAGLSVIDLGADFRIRDPEVYAAAYGPHPCPELLPQAVYGLPELHRAALAGARLVASPGCYPTATAIAALPLVEAGLADWIVSDCLSGVSGAGRKAGAKNLYCEVQEQAVAYKMAGSHRHAPEMEQTLGVPVHFTPHLVPMVRGMLATVTVRPTRPISQGELHALYEARYADHPMVTVRDAPPSTAEVRGTARACVHPTVDATRGAIHVSCAIDNLGKGAAAQAVHAMNLSQGLPETAGLPTFPLLP
ncbi:MAG: N-acetyl-gamma-glutamyl-phosphate reductase [Alphaproteobacteria bacterium]|nr:N-acetyl-gamma-glutamyl-phosphate reductase [Alphaproteobacteria bacterium]MCB9796900.1 N-acetyl-gamma-glutamyl-phosphate reductase [Alphaproteobacteria bacterium]